ncbi:3-deoxy-D-manno-octulosonic acid transferase [Rhizomicrobium electricum]|uniref:3-deoxy-D-manno-octulosonic acid transferase n=1 Tax=Rhizomicrobium electricum TaxID=480070 RepID=A0ABP3P923_9PROT|nr:3-deoxy-D-manno-octulosonic acid transferase [Rhizomicrobium electricum]NIJ47746.1 3-deoxy-D-manno-octulosonic-acid transferase [Rhizomicrobium electricum]
MKPLGLTAYRAVSTVLSPVVPALLRRRILRGKEHEERNAERLGHASLPRPEGTLIWVHGASVGECIAALPLIDALLKAVPCKVLVTSGTVTSAKLMAERLPEGAIHQFVPVDTPAATMRFLHHWKPQVGLFVDSDIWPNLIVNARDRGVKLALINARMTERSFRNWRWAKKTAAEIMSSYRACLAQDEEIAARFRALGTPNVEVIGSLKADAPMLPADPDKLEALRAAIGGRPVLLAAQTHQGEEETILPAHDALRRKFPDLLTIIVPRHTQRAGDIVMLCGTRVTKKRSDGELPDADTAVYIADTMGELGLFYRLTRFCFVGGSLIRHGGQNPLEPAKLGCAVLTGPYTYNFTKAFETLLAAQGAGSVNSCSDIVSLASKLLGDPNEAERLGDAAKRGAVNLGGAVAKTVDVVVKMLDARS